MARGLTLIEMLAVVTLLALTVSLLTASFAGSVGAARLREAASIVREADARARLRSRTTGPIRLTLSEDRSALLLRTDESADGGPAPIKLPEFARAFLLSADGTAPLGSIRFDRLGRSRDYRIRIELGELARSLHIAGLTGWIQGGDT